MWIAIGICIAIVAMITGYAALLLGGDADDRAVARYEAERDAFERLFK